MVASPRPHLEETASVLKYCRREGFSVPWIGSGANLGVLLAIRPYKRAIDDPAWRRLSERARLCLAETLARYDIFHDDNLARLPAIGANTMARK
jgi:hypothetical protein